MRPTNRNSFIRSLKSKGFKEEIVIKIGLYDLVTSTTLESNKSLIANTPSTVRSYCLARWKGQLYGGTVSKGACVTFN
jgi:hypothetical protein